MKLNREEKAEYKELKQLFDRQAGAFITDMCFSGEYGITLAVRREGRFYHISTAVCGAGDKFNKKRGRYEALVKLYGGCYLALPVGFPFQFGEIFDDTIDDALRKAELKRKAV